MQQHRLVVRVGEHCFVVTNDYQRFKNLECVFHVGVQEPLSLALGWSNGLEWTTLYTETLILNQGPQTTTTTTAGYFSITYDAQKRFNPAYRGIMAMGRITELNFDGILQDAWNAFERSHGHRIVCKLRLGMGPQSCCTYLGRAQHIVTDEKGNRTYTWLARESSKEKDAFLLSPRTQEDWETHVRETKELALIKDPTSPRSEVVAEIDSDSFENKRRVLPVVLHNEIQLQFFNLLGGSGGNYVESSHVFWQQSVKPERRSLRGTKEPGGGSMVLRLTPHMEVKISLQKAAEDEKTSVVQVTLEVQDYTKTLVQMGEGLPPKTF